MNGIKNLHVFKEKIVPIALAATLSLSLSACGGKVEMQSVDMGDLMAIEEVQGATIIDDMIARGELQYDEDLNIIQAADQLDRYMRIVEMTDGIDFTGVDSLEPLSDEIYEQTLNMSKEEIEALIELSKYKGDDVVALEAKLTALKKLNYLHNYCRDWVYSNGDNICTRIMIVAVKGSVADEFDRTDFAGITIPERHNFGGEPDSYSVKVDGEVYIVPTGEGEIWNTINYIYELQSADLSDGDQENRFATYDKAINYAKTTIAAGSNVKNNKLVAQYDADYIEGNFVR